MVSCSYHLLSGSDAPRAKHHPAKCSRRKKIKCDGIRSACTPCKRSLSDCTYPAARRGRGRDRCHRCVSEMAERSASTQSFGSQHGQMTASMVPIPSGSQSLCDCTARSVSAFTAANNLYLDHHHHQLFRSGRDAEVLEEPFGRSDWRCAAPVVSHGTNMAFPSGDTANHQSTAALDDSVTAMLGTTQVGERLGQRRQINSCQPCLADFEGSLGDGLATPVRSHWSDWPFFCDAPSVQMPTYPLDSQSSHPVQARGIDGRMWFDILQWAGTSQDEADGSAKSIGRPGTVTDTIEPRSWTEADHDSKSMTSSDPARFHASPSISWSSDVDKTRRPSPPFNVRNEQGSSGGGFQTADMAISMRLRCNHLDRVRILILDDLVAKTLPNRQVIPVR